MTATADANDPFDHRRFVFEEPPATQSGQKQVRFVNLRPRTSPSKKTASSMMALTNKHPSVARGWLTWRTLRSVILPLLLVMVYTTCSQQINDSRFFVHSLIPRISHLYANSVRLLSSTPVPEQASLSTLVKEHIDSSIQRALQELYTPRDFALSLDGARIATGLTPEHSFKNPADCILHENLHGGRCWALKGTRGQVGIATLSPIHPTNVTIDHAPREVVDDISQAPRRVVVWGVVDGQFNHARYAEYRPLFESAHERGSPLETDGQTLVALSVFEYNIHSSRHVQTFPVFDHVLQSGMTFGVFVFEFESNWGGTGTCIYRVRLHGSVVRFNIANDNM
ncbi:hypothetical protein C8Q79DRAFT_924086 [Trametes meyenii]|nr:hypothetical protein C8Q79DRAFT_924086 [Trametes meyenii]